MLQNTDAEKHRVNWLFCGTAFGINAATGRHVYERTDAVRLQKLLLLDLCFCGYYCHRSFGLFCHL